MIMFVVTLVKRNSLSRKHILEVTFVSNTREIYGAQTLKRNLLFKRGTTYYKSMV